MYHFHQFASTFFLLPHFLIHKLQSKEFIFKNQEGKLCIGAFLFSKKKCVFNLFGHPTESRFCCFLPQEPCQVWEIGCGERYCRCGTCCGQNQEVNCACRSHKHTGFPQTGGPHHQTLF